MPQKRMGLHKDKNQKKISKKQQFQEPRVCNSEAANYVDRISKLPEHLIHHILSRLRYSKDVTRTSALSKEWRCYWASFQEIDFDQRNFQVQGSQDNSGGLQAAGADKTGFMNYVYRFLETRLEHFCCLTCLRFHVISFNHVLAHAMNYSISAAIQKGIEELDIHVKVVADIRYDLPQIVLTSKTITSLKLYGCWLDSFAVVELSSLRWLSIEETPVDDGVLQKFFQSCPLIEDFRLAECVGLETLHVPLLLNLKKVEVHKCHGLCSIEVNGMNLQTFCFHEKERIHCNIKLACCESLRNLTIKASKITDKWFQEQISKFLALENLTLLECRSLNRITIKCSKLKRLSITKCSNLEDANIEAPNLSSFEYTGDIVCFSNLNSSQLQDVMINFESGLPSSETKKFRESISHLEGFRLVLQESEQNDVTISEGLTGIILPHGYGYKVELTRSPVVLQRTIDCRLQECRPSCLYVLCSSYSKLIKEILPNRGETRSCCQYYLNKCWRHYLKDFTVAKSPGLTIFRLEWLPLQS